MRKAPISLVEHTDNPVIIDAFARIEKSGPVGVKNMHRLLANSPQILSANVGLAHALRNETELDPALRELGILRVLSHHGGHYEINHHRNIGRAVGLEDAEIDAACGDASDATFQDPKKEAVISFAEYFAKGKGFPDGVIDKINENFSNRFIFELSYTLSIYIGLSYLTAALDVPHD